MNDMNHFEYLHELSSDDNITNDEKQRAYKRKGGIDMCCHPFVLDESWESLVKCLASSSEDSNQT